MVLHFHFTFKPFLGYAQKRERARERERARKKEKLAEIVQSFDRRDREASIGIAQSVDRDRVNRRSRSRSRLCADHDRAKHRADRDLAFAPIAIARSVRI